MKNYFYLILAYILTLFIVITAVYLIMKRNYTSVPIVYNTYIDTIYITKHHFVKTAKLDSAKQTIKDTLYIQTAELDTTIQGSELKVKYYFPPLNKFEINLSLQERVKVFIDTITIEKEVIKEGGCGFKDYLLPFFVGVALALLF